MKKPLYIAVMGLMFAVMAILSTLESLFTPVLPPGVRLGLPNIIIMLAMLILGAPSGLLLVFMKAAFVLLTRGVTAGIMSAAGGILAFFAILLLMRRSESSAVLTSVCGAAAHSFGQLAASVLLTGSLAVVAYAPFMLIISVISGVFTGMAVRIIFPVLKSRADALRKSEPR